MSKWFHISYAIVMFFTCSSASADLQSEINDLAIIVNSSTYTVPLEYKDQVNQSIARLRREANTSSGCTVAKNSSGYFGVYLNRSLVTGIQYSAIWPAADEYRQLVSSGTCSNLRVACSIEMRNGAYYVQRNGTSVSPLVTPISAARDYLKELVEKDLCL